MDTAGTMLKAQYEEGRASRPAGLIGKFLVDRSIDLNQLAAENTRRSGVLNTYSDMGILDRLTSPSYWLDPRGLTAEVSNMTGSMIPFMLMSAVMPEIGAGTAAGLIGGGLSRFGAKKVAQLFKPGGAGAEFLRDFARWAPTGVVDAASNAGEVAEELRRQGYTDAQIADRIGSAMLYELPYDVVLQGLFGGFLGGKGVRKFTEGGSVLRNIAANAALGGFEALNEAGQEFVQTQAVEQALGNPVGTFMNPTDEERKAFDAAFIGTLPMVVAGGARNVTKNWLRGKAETTQSELQSSAPVKTSGDENVDSLIAQAAEKYGIPVNLLHAIAQTESDYNQGAKSEAGAIGMMQLMPDTAAGLGVDPHDLAGNIDGGAKYLREMLDTFDGDVEKAVAAYNAGPNAVNEHGGIPPFKETQDYVNKVMGGLEGYDVDVPRRMRSLLDDAAPFLGVTMDNGENGCVEAVTKIGAQSCPFLAQELESGVVNVDRLVEHAGDRVIPFDPNQLEEGDVIVYGDESDPQRHVVLYDGKGGYIGNSTEQNKVVQGEDYNAMGAWVPTKIIKTGAQFGGAGARTVAAPVMPDFTGLIADETNIKETQEAIQKLIDTDSLSPAQHAAILDAAQMIRDTPVGDGTDAALEAEHVNEWQDLIDRKDVKGIFEKDPQRVVQTIQQLGKDQLAQKTWAAIENQQQIEAAKQTLQAAAAQQNVQGIPAQVGNTVQQNVPVQGAQQNAQASPTQVEGSVAQIVPNQGMQQSEAVIQPENVMQNADNQSVNAMQGVPNQPQNVMQNAETAQGVSVQNVQNGVINAPAQEGMPAPQVNVTPAPLETIPTEMEQGVAQRQQTSQTNIAQDEMRGMPEQVRQEEAPLLEIPEYAAARSRGDWGTVAQIAKIARMPRVSQFYHALRERANAAAEPVKTPVPVVGVRPNVPTRLPDNLEERRKLGRALGRFMLANGIPDSPILRDNLAMGRGKAIKAANDRISAWEEKRAEQEARAAQYGGVNARQTAQDSAQSAQNAVDDRILAQRGEHAQNASQTVRGKSAQKQGNKKAADKGGIVVVTGDEFGAYKNIGAIQYYNHTLPSLENGNKNEGASVSTEPESLNGPSETPSIHAPSSTSTIPSEAEESKENNLNDNEREAVKGLSADAKNVYQMIRDKLAETKNKKIARAASVGAALFARHADIIARKVRAALGKPFTAMDYYRTWFDLRYGGEESGFTQAAMKKSDATSLSEFSRQMRTPEAGSGSRKKTFLRTTAPSGAFVDVAQDDMIHMHNHHPEMTDEDFSIIQENMEKFLRVHQDKTGKGDYGGETVLCKIKTPRGVAGVSYELLPMGRIFLKTAFFDNENGIDNWIAKNGTSKDLMYADTEKRGNAASMLTGHPSRTADAADSLTPSVAQPLSLFMIQERIGIVNGEKFNQSAWHGTPHDFDGFDLGAIGTGEGAQVHGWGLYFAKERRVSEGYKKRLSTKRTIIHLGENSYVEYGSGYKEISSGERVDGASALGFALDGILASEGDISSVIQTFENDIKESDAENSAFYKEVVRILRENDSSVEEGVDTSRLFEVEIPDDDVLLDEQKPFDEQPKFVQEKLDKLFAEVNPEEIIDFIDKEKIGVGGGIIGRLKMARKAIKEREWMLSELNDVIESLLPETVKNDILDDLAEYGLVSYDSKNMPIPERLEYLEGKRRWVENDLAERKSRYKEYLAKIFENDPLIRLLRGKSIYKAVAKIKGGDKAASLALNEVGIKGITYVGGRDGRCYVIFDDKAISIIEKFNQQMNEIIKGTTQDVRDGQRIVSLFEEADESTFLHEMGHLFLLDLERMADMSPTSAEELQSVRKWAAWSEGQAAEYKGTPFAAEFAYIDARIRAAIKRGDEKTANKLKRQWEHERFARGFEMYLKHGEAPTKELRAVFAKFRAFLQRVYQAFTGTGGRATPEVEAIMARMISIEDSSDLSAYPQGKKTAVYTDSGKKIPVQYRVVSADDLIASHDAGALEVNPGYPTALQPRDRERVMMREQVTRMANTLRPEDLADGRNLNQGAPLIRSDGVVLNGNGRTIAIQRAQARNKDRALAYKDYLVENAATFGLSKEDVEGVKNPALVREVQGDISDELMQDIIGSTTGGARMGASEAAHADAEKVTYAMLDTYVPNDKGDLTTAANRSFVAGILHKLVGKDEMNAYLDKDGYPNADGIQRVKRALFALAYGDDELIAKMAESTDDDIRNVSNGLMTAAPMVARLSVKQGAPYVKELQDAIGTAVKQLDSLRRSGQSVKDYLGAQALFAEHEDSAEMRAILSFLDENKRSGKRIATYFSGIAKTIDGMETPRANDLFETQLPSLMDVLEETKKYAVSGGQEGLFEDNVQDVAAIKNALTNLARAAWNDKTAQGKVSFAPSRKLRDKVQELFGHDIDEVFITADDMRHIKKHHSEYEEKRGQVSLTPESITDVYDVVNDFDEATLEQSDAAGNQKMMIVKDLDGRTFVLLVERGKSKAEVKTVYKYKKPSPMSDVTSPEPNVRNDSAKVSSTSNISPNEAESKQEPTLENILQLAPALKKAALEYGAKDERGKVTFADEERKQEFIKVAKALLSAGERKPSARRQEALQKMLDGIRLIPPTRVSPRKRVIADWGREMGVTVVFFKGDPSLHGFHQDGVTFLNVDSEITPQWTFWHEAMHWMKANNPDIYNELVQTISGAEGFTKEQLDAYRKEIGAPEMSDADVIEEMLADALPDVRHRVPLLRDVGKRDTGLVQRVVAWIRDVMRRFHDRFNTPKGGLTNDQRRAMIRAFGNLVGSLRDADGKPIFRIENEGARITLRGGKPLPAVKYSLDNRGKEGDNEGGRNLGEARKEAICSNVIARMKMRVREMLKQGIPFAEIQKELEDENSTSREEALRVFKTQWNIFNSPRVNKRNIVERITKREDFTDDEVNELFEQYKSTMKEMLDYGGFIYKEAAFQQRGNREFLAGVHSWRELERANARHGGSAHTGQKNSLNTKHLEQQGAFSTPTSKESMRWIAEHPFKYDESRTMDENIQRAESLAQEYLDTFGTTDQINTPARQELRREIADKLYGKGAAKKEGKVWLVLGVPASGKSTISDPIMEREGALLIDSDEAKKLLPEFSNGLLAGAVHEESSDIATNVMERAIANHDNIVWPLVGKTRTSIDEKVQKFKEAGYEVNLVYVDLPIEKAIERTKARFRHTGRLVPPRYLQSVGLKPKQNYDKIKTEEGVDSYEAWNNDVARGELPVRTEYGSIHAEKTRKNQPTTRGMGRRGYTSVYRGQDVGAYRRETQTNTDDTVNNTTNRSDNRGGFSTPKLSDEKAKKDAAYRNAVRVYQTARNPADRIRAYCRLKELVREAAAEAGFVNAVPEQTAAYKVRVKAPPQKTVKVYKVFTLADDGSPTALFIGGTEKLPQGVWLDAQDAYHFQAKNGLYYVPSTQNPYTQGGKTGASVEIPNETVRKELIARGFLPNDSRAQKITALAYRPGWHAGTLPFFPQGGKKAPQGSPYPNVHRYNQVVFECEMSADKDYTHEAESQPKARTKDGSLNTKKADLQYMPEDGYYFYATNPLTHGHPELGLWAISGSLKINRALSQEECDSILMRHGMMPQGWEQGRMNLSDLGYVSPVQDAARKTLAPITYDDNGHVVPLSERFNPAVDDIRFSVNTQEDRKGNFKLLKDRIRSLVGVAPLDNLELPGRVRRTVILSPAKLEQRVKGGWIQKKNIISEEKQKDGKITVTYYPDTHDVGYADYVKSVRQVAKRNPFVKVLYDLAHKAMKKQEKLRNEFGKSLKEFAELMKNEKDMEKISVILWQGDAEGRVFSDAELRSLGANERVIKAYKLVRRELEKAYKLLRDAQTQVKTRSQTLDPESVETFKKNHWIKDADVISETLRADGTVLLTWRGGKTYDVKSKTMTAAELKLMQEDENVNVTSAMPIQAALDDFRAHAGRGLYQVNYVERIKPVFRRTGYMPHFFHEWMIYEKIKDPTTGKERYVSVGSGRTMNEAVKIGNEIAKDNADKQYVLRPKGFDLGAENAVVIGDMDFAQMSQKLAESTEISLADARSLLLEDAGASLKSRHRFFGSLLERKDGKGFDQDVQWVLAHYFNSAARYIAMEDFKPTAISMYERFFGRFDDEPRSLTAQYCKNLINDVNGNPRGVEVWLNDLLKKTWIGKHIADSYGDRVALAVNGELSTWNAITKLGLFNFASMAVNFSQFINVGAALNDYGYAAKGLKRALNPSALDEKIIEASGLLDDINMLADNGGYTQRRGGKVRGIYSALKKGGEWTLIPFQKADMLMRKAAVLGAYYQGVEQKGMKTAPGDELSAEALAYAQEINDDANFDYSSANAPNAFRLGSVVTQQLFQFQKYPIMQFEFMYNILKNGTRGQKVRFFVPYVLFCGMCGSLPFGGLFNQLFSFLFGLATGDDEDIAQEVKAEVLRWAGKDPVKKAIAETALYGILAPTFGLDISGRIGMSNAFGGEFYGAQKPESVAGVIGQQLGGPAANSIYNMFHQFHEGNNIEALKAVSPALGNMFQAVVGESRTTRHRVNARYDTAYDKIAHALGFRSVEESKNAFIMHYEYEQKGKAAQIKREAIQDYIADPSDENRRTINALGITDKQIKEARIQQERTALERAREGRPKTSNKSGASRRRKEEAQRDTLYDTLDDE
jgi:predicted ABC-type ATPase